MAFQDCSSGMEKREAGTTMAESQQANFFKAQVCGLLLTIAQPAIVAFFVLSRSVQRSTTTVDFQQGVEKNWVLLLDRGAEAPGSP